VGEVCHRLTVGADFAEILALQLDKVLGLRPGPVNGVTISAPINLIRVGVLDYVFDMFAVRFE
jgi:hypothetical protein